MGLFAHPGKPPHLKVSDAYCLLCSGKRARAKPEYRQPCSDLGSENRLAWTPQQHWPTSAAAAIEHMEVDVATALGIETKSSQAADALGG